MDYENRSVPLYLITDTDRTFNISFGRSDRAIDESIRHVGLIHEPILIMHQGHYRIVSGFARIAACQRLGWTQIPCRCLRADTPYLKCALLAIADNAGQRALNIVEQARALGLLDRCDDLSEEWTGILQSFGIPVNAQWVGILKHVVRMSNRLQRGLVEGAIALPVALRLHGLKDAEAAEELARLMWELRLGLNRQRELLEWVLEIALREDIIISDIVNQDPIAQWRRDDKKDRAQTTQLIRDYLRKRRYPEICASEKRYTGLLKNLRLSKNLHLTPPPYFEGKTFQLRLDFQSKQDLQELNLELRDMIESPFLLELLSPAVLQKS